MNRATGLIVALAVGLTTACAAVGGPAANGVAGERPRDDQHTRAAGVELAQAALRQGAEAEVHYQRALESAEAAIEADATNPRAYMLAGQAAIGIQDWVQADTMFARAEELHPPFASQIASEREEGWVMAYNLGAEALGAGDLDRALELFRGADLMYDARPEARMAVATVHIQRGEMAEAVTAFERAMEILARDPPEDFDEEVREGWIRDRQVAAFNMAQLMGQTGRYGEAADVLEQFMAEFDLDPETQLQAATARAGFLAQAGRTEEAEAAYAGLLDREDLGANEFFQVGIGFFNTGDYARAAEAFATAAELNPYSRDAYLNLVQSLYSAALDLEDEPQTAERDQRLRTMYRELLEAADRVMEFDPLNRNLLTFTLRAYRSLTDLAEGEEARRLTTQMQDVYRAYEAQRFEVADIGMAPLPNNRAEVSGMLINHAGAQGGEVQIRFTILDLQGRTMDTSTARVTVPARDAAVEFTTSVNLSRGEFAGWRYELVD